MAEWTVLPAAWVPHHATALRTYNWAVTQCRAHVARLDWRIIRLYVRTQPHCTSLRQNECVFYCDCHCNNPTVSHIYKKTRQHCSTVQLINYRSITQLCTGPTIYSHSISTNLLSLCNTVNDAFLIIFIGRWLAWGLTHKQITDTWRGEWEYEVCEWWNGTISAKKIRALYLYGPRCVGKNTCAEPEIYCCHVI